jgi:adenylate cyclase
MLKLVGLQRLKIALILSVFLLFLLNSIGLLTLTVITKPDISLNSELISQFIGNKSFLSNQIFETKEFYIFLLTGILLSILLPVLNPIKASLLTFVCMGVPVYINYINPGSALLPLEYSLLTILILYIVNILISYFIEIHAKQEIINVFGKYIPPQLVQEISKSPGKISLKTESREMTVLFCDLHNFTSSSEHLSPQQISAMLNTYFTEMSKILHSCNATIDKFIGDAVMAFWGAPLVQEDHAQLSILASFEMQKAMERLEPSFAGNGWPVTKMGIGINSGKMHVGNMGSEHRITYTVVGDAVNLASRLEGLTRTYKVPTIVSEYTAQATTNIFYRELDIVTVRGREIETRIFQPLYQSDQFDAQAAATITKEVEKQQQALQLYYEKKYKESLEAFDSLAKDHPADPYYKIMRDKSASL